MDLVRLSIAALAAVVMIMGIVVSAEQMTRLEELEVMANRFREIAAQSTDPEEAAKLLRLVDLGNVEHYKCDKSDFARFREFRGYKHPKINELNTRYLVASYKQMFAEACKPKFEATADEVEAQIPIQEYKARIGSLIEAETRFREGPGGPGELGEVPVEAVADWLDSNFHDELKQIAKLGAEKGGPKLSELLHEQLFGMCKDIVITTEPLTWLYATYAYGPYAWTVPNWSSRRNFCNSILRNHEHIFGYVAQPLFKAKGIKRIFG